MFQSGDIIDQYQLTEFLGSGSYGSVFAARNAVSLQRCAIKIIPLSGSAGGRELRALRQYHDLNHPNLLKICHSGIVGDHLYYTMELADGKLADRHLSPSALRSAAAKLADALAALHENGLLHRDIKPDNLLFLNGEPLIGDFGLMTADCGASLTGTPGFLPPEVRNGGAALSEYSDLYALAKSFYCLLSGNSPGDYPKFTGPFDADSAILLQAVMAVCDYDGKITSAVRFRDCLLTAKPPGSRRKIRLVVTGIGCAALIALAGMLYVSFAPFPLRFFSRREQMAYALYEAGHLSPAEKLAIDRQQNVFDELQNEAMRQAKITTDQNRSINAVVQSLRRKDELFEKMLKAREEQSPEFRCFFVLYNKVTNLSKPLHWALAHPERTDAGTLEKDFALWRQKRAEYCQLRDSLLQEKNADR